MRNTIKPIENYSEMLVVLLKRLLFKPTPSFKPELLSFPNEIIAQLLFFHIFLALKLSAAVLHNWLITVFTSNTRGYDSSRYLVVQDYFCFQIDLALGTCTSGGGVYWMGIGSNTDLNGKKIKSYFNIQNLRNNIDAVLEFSSMIMEWWQLQT